MPVQHEDTVLGGADISGDASPVQARPPAQRMADVQRQMDHRPKPQAQGAKHLPGEDKPPKKSDDGKEPDGAGGKLQAATGSPAQPAPPPTNPVVPIDWRAKAKDDPFTTHQHSKHVSSVLDSLLNFGQHYLTSQQQNLQQASGAIDYTENVWSAFADSKALSQSVKNIWDSNTAQGKVSTWVLEGLTGAIPPAELAKSLDKQLTGAGERQATADVVGGGLPLTANPLNLVPGGTGFQVAAYVAPNLVQALGSTDPNERANALTWVAITGSLLSAGHLGAFKGVLSDALGRWPELEKTLDRLVEGRKAAQTRAQDPKVDPRLDFLPKLLREDAFQGSVTKKAAAGSEKQIIERVPGSRPGEFVERNVTAERTKAALKAAGAESRGDLEQRITEGRVSPAQADALIKHWGEIGFNYDLNVVTRPDSPIVNPLPIIQQAAPEVRARSVRALTAANAMVHQMHDHLLQNDDKPMVSLWRSLTGHARGTDDLDRNFAAAMLDLAGNHDGEALGRAIEGDQAAFDALPPEGQVYVSTWRILSNEERKARAAAGIPFAVGDYLWRIPRKARNVASGRGGGGAGALVTEAEKHRTLATMLHMVDGEPQIALTQRYATVAAANEAVAKQREAVLNHLTDWSAPLNDEWSRLPNAQAIRTKALNDLPGATKDAKDWVQALYRPFETNAHRILARGGVGRQIKALHAEQAVATLLDTKVRIPNPDKAGGEIIDNAAHRTGASPEQDKLLRQAGYRAVDAQHFSGVLFHPQMADLLDRATQYGRSSRPALVKGSLAVESAFLRAIMYQPAVHGWNVGGRMLVFAGMHAATNPLGLVSHLFGGGDAQALRTEAINAGVVTHGRNANFLPETYKQIGDALGEHDLFEVPIDRETVSGHSAETAELAGLGQPKMNFLQRANNLLWSGVDQFAVAAYHIEKNAALAAGRAPVDAALYAARRANSWAGYVSPEDSTPWIHDAARLVMFAPAFWRTWGELFVPIYRNSGVAMTRAQALHMAKQEVALVAATVGVGWGLNNAFNYMTSGQFSDRNEPQNRMKLEVRRPEVIRALQQAHYPGADKINPATGYGPNGEVLSIDNPLTRFQKDVVGATGLTQHADYQSTDTVDGLEQFLMNRLSPFLSAGAGIMNLDLYQSVKDHQARAVDPGSETGHPTPASVAAGLLYGAPNGSNLVRQIFSSQKPSPLTLPGGAQVPPGVAKVAEALPKTGEGLLWQALTGTNGPYTTTERTRGQQPSDDEYRKYSQIKTTYENEMTALNAEVAGGQKTPAQWLTSYKQIHGTYVDQSSAFFMNAPEYVNGPLALTSNWEGLYTKATGPDGSVDPGQLSSLQAEWRAKHSAADYQAVQGELAKNDQKYPMLGLYHKTLAAYGKWQDSWANQHGYDAGALRSEIRQYGALYGDNVASQHYLAQHRDLAAYERAKKTQWEESIPGLMYGLFYQSSSVSSYMRARHLTAQTVEQEAQAQP